MDYTTKLNVKNGCPVIAMRGGSSNGRTYEPGTRGIVRRVPEESPRVLTESGVDLGFVNLSNWERLLKCPACREEYAEQGASQKKDDDEETTSKRLCPPCKSDPRREAAARERVAAEKASKAPEAPAVKKRTRRGRKPLEQVA
jgi:hypothetical protein